jgi:hypothetical protein
MKVTCGNTHLIEQTSVLIHECQLVKLTEEMCSKITIVSSCKVALKII